MHKEKLVTHGSKHDMSDACEILNRCVGLTEDDDTEVHGELVDEEADHLYYFFSYALTTAQGELIGEGRHSARAADAFAAEKIAKAWIAKHDVRINGQEGWKVTLIMEHTKTHEEVLRDYPEEERKEITFDP